MLVFSKKNIFHPNKQSDYGYLQMIQLDRIAYYNIFQVSFMEEKKTAYFAFGKEGKTSLVSQFCRQHEYHHVKNPIPETFNSELQKTVIIEGTSHVFKKIESKIKDLRPIFIGKDFSDEEQQIRSDYIQIGKAINCPTASYAEFRRVMYPQLLFFYGPVRQQSTAISRTFANNIGFEYANLPQNTHQLIKNFNKTENYVVNGLFESSSEIKVLEEYFNFKIIHLKYNRIDLPKNSDFFDREFQIMSFLKSKPYYFKINGNQPPNEVMSQIGNNLCPELIAVNAETQNQRSYFNNFAKEKQQLQLSMKTINEVLTRKNESQPQNQFQKIKLINSIIYQNLNRKRIFLLDFPHHVSQIVAFQNMNRKFSSFLDLSDPSSHHFSTDFTNKIYFLQQQKRVLINKQISLSDQLDGKVEYWIISGPACSGKSTASKYMASQFGFKLIEFEPFLATLKEKLITPEDGEQLPFRKILAYFKDLFKNDRSVYVLDGFPYDNKELAQWITQIGPPKILNVKLQADQLTKRTRKKNQADLNAEVGQEEKLKIAQTLAKNNSWIDRLKEVSPLSMIHIIDFSPPLILAQKLINKILRPRIYLVQRHTELVYQNVAIKYNLGFVNLDQKKLRQCQSIVLNLKKKDVILCYYDQQEEKLIIQDLYWIEKNLGDIKYLGIWNSQLKILEKQKYRLQPPIVEEKPKVEGAEGEEKPSEEPPADQIPKKELDIYSVQWSKNDIHNNISQWFHHTKKNIIERQNDGNSIFNKFQEVIESIDAGKYVYEQALAE